LLERDARAFRRADEDIADAVDVLPKLREKANDQIEPPLAFIDLGNRLSANGGLHDSVHIRTSRP
jgi:hypothetical protein